MDFLAGIFVATTFATLVAGSLYFRPHYSVKTRKTPFETSRPRKPTSASTKASNPFSLFFLLTSVLAKRTCAWSTLSDTTRQAIPVWVGTSVLSFGARSDDDSPRQILTFRARKVFCRKPCARDRVYPNRTYAMLRPAVKSSGRMKSVKK